MSSSRKVPVKIDLQMKLDMLKAEDEGLDVDEIAEKFSITHPIYVTRVLDNRDKIINSPDVRLLAGDEDVGRKRKRNESGQVQEVVNMELDEDDEEEPTPRKKRVTRKNTADIPEITVEDSPPRKLETPSKTSRLFGRSTKKSTRTPAKTVVSAIPEVNYQADRSCMAVADTNDAISSPFNPRHPDICYVLDQSVQTDKNVYYEEEYIVFLKESYESRIEEKEYTISQQQKEISSLKKEIEVFKADLLAEKEKRALEKGWKKHF
ncbi:hypothetical protein HDE_07421 [Halotydeus destructor]|nr:hypothetical protein HDE_07421 [Halotydeus destructor]